MLGALLLSYNSLLSIVEAVDERSRHKIARIRAYNSLLSIVPAPRPVEVVPATTEIPKGHRSYNSLLSIVLVKRVMTTNDHGVTYNSLLSIVDLEEALKALERVENLQFSFEYCLASQEHSRCDTAVHTYNSLLSIVRYA